MGLERMSMRGSITPSVRQWRKRGLVAALLAVAFAGAGGAETIVLRHFTLVDGTGRAPVADQALVAVDGRLKWVGPDTRLKVPAGAAIEDLRGKYVLPGLIDSHVHLGLVDGITQDLKFQTRESIERQLHLYAAYGITSVQALGTEKDLIFPIRDAERATRPDMARVFTAGQWCSRAAMAVCPASISRLRRRKMRVGWSMPRLPRMWMSSSFGSMMSSVRSPAACPRRSAAP